MRDTQRPTKPASRPSAADLVPVMLAGLLAPALGFVKADNGKPAPTQSDWARHTAADAD